MKVRKNITLSEGSIINADKLMIEYGCDSLSSLIDFLLQKEVTQNAVANQVVDKIEEKYKNLFTRMRLGINEADRNSQILMEIMNSYSYYNSGVGTMLTSVEETQLIKDCKEEVKRKIEAYKQNNDWKNHNKEKK